MAQRPDRHTDHNRAIRVFISSTFRDMQEERDELVKRVFPQLRKICEKRGVTWGEVDLRWGITEEQVSRGKVLSICLDEIRDCQPFFIGLLGERYGWIPDNIPLDVRNQEPWIEGLEAKSITELEILHGVLNNPEIASQAYFYFRDPAYIETLADPIKKDYQEIPTIQEIEELGQEKANSLVQGRKDKLDALKKKIKDGGYPVRDNYRDPFELGELVLKDMTSVIDQLFPEGSSPSPLEQEILAHEAWAIKLTQGYIVREDYFYQLDEHSQGISSPLIITGKSGSGKSALLANWANHYQSRYPQENLIIHFIGSTKDSSDWEAMLRKILGEIMLDFTIGMEIPEDPIELRAAFANFLNRIPNEKKLVLIFDGITQLDDKDSALDLIWLPKKIPENIRMIISCLPGPSLSELENRRWPILFVEPLSIQERKALAENVLSTYRKTLNSDHMEQISSAPQCANPLYLRTLLEELRLFGIYEELDNRIHSYLRSDTIESLYEIIFRRYEEDYERERPGLVREVMQLLWAARNGLSQTELLDLLGRDGLPLPYAYWSPLYLALEGSLVNRLGLLGFRNSYLRNAVEKRYLASNKEQKFAHKRLANYFESRPLNSRKVAELPWQLTKTQEWERLVQVLTVQEFFMDAWKANEFEIKKYWSVIETNSDIQAMVAYQPYPEIVPQNAQYLWDLARLLHISGYPGESMKFREDLSRLYREENNLEMLGGTLSVRAIIHREQGEIDRALELFEECETIYRSLKDDRGIAAAITGKATLLTDRGEFSKALELHQESARVFKELNDTIGFVTSMGSQAIILRELGKPDLALSLLEEEERIYRELGLIDGIARSFGNQALIHHDRGDYEIALDLHQKNEKICRELGNSFSLAISLGNQAIIIRELGDLDGALTMHQAEEQINREIGNLPGLAASLHNQAALYEERGELAQVLVKLREEGQIYNEIGDLNNYQVSLDHQAAILRSQGEADKALELYKKLEELCRKEKNSRALAQVLDNQVGLYWSRGEIHEALRISSEQVQLSRKAAAQDMLALALFNNALLMIEANHNRDQALKQAKEAYELARIAGRPDIAQAISSGLKIIQN